MSTAPSTRVRLSSLLCALALVGGALGAGCDAGAVGGPGGRIVPTDGGTRDAKADDPFRPDAGPPVPYDCRTASDLDGDRIPDAIEGSGDPDADGLSNAEDVDADGDGLLDAAEAGDSDPCSGATDTNTDGVPDYLDPDQDDDGLVDGLEARHGTELRVADSDGDGVVDGVEVLAGTNPANATSTIPATDFYVVLPYREPAQHKELSFRARLGKADIFFLIDTTGSMGDEIANVRSSLSGTIVPAIRDVVAESMIGVGEYRDFAYEPYGQGGDYPFRLHTAVTDNVAAVQTGLGRLSAAGGGDIPESQVEALHHTVTDPCLSGGGVGAACFRPGAQPIIVVVTDAPSHNGPGGGHRYDFSARTFSDAVNAINAIDGKVLGVYTHNQAQAHLTELARSTSSLSATGAPIVYSAGGGTVDRAVVDGIAELAGGIPQSVTTERIDDTRDAVDARRFMRNITPLRASSPGVSMNDTAFLNVPGGTQVTFDVEFVNDFVEHGPAAQVFRASIDVVEAVTRDRLDMRNVYVVVPAAQTQVTLD